MMICGYFQSIQIENKDEWEREREVRTGERKDEEIRGGRAVVENQRELGKRENG